MSEPLYKVIGKHLRDARKRLKMKQADVARVSHVSVPYYGKLERGEICPSLDRLILICETLKLPPTEVFRGIMPLEEVLQHGTPTDEEFAEFFSHLAGRIDDKMKIVMMEVCRNIETLNM